MHNPVLSVIVCAYNVERYIEKCILSIINQDYRDIEIIVVNDASTDKTTEKLEFLVNKLGNIHLISLDKNVGRSEARNVGIRVSRGEFISFIDGDDEIKPRTYSKLIPLFTKDIDVIWYGIDIIYEAHEEYKDSDEGYYSVKKEGKGNIGISELLEYDCSCCNKIFRRSQLTEEYLFKGRYYEDALFYLRFFSEKRNIYFCKDKYYVYYRHPVSIMSQTMDGTPGIAINHIYILDELYKFWENKKLIPRFKAEFCKIFVAYFWSAYRYCLPYEKAHVIYEASLRLRKWELSEYCDSIFRCIHDGTYSIVFTPQEEFDSSKFTLRKLKGFEKLLCIRNENGYKVVRMFKHKVLSVKR